MLMNITNYGVLRRQWPKGIVGQELTGLKWGVGVESSRFEEIEGPCRRTGRRSGG